MLLWESRQAAIDFCNRQSASAITTYSASALAMAPATRCLFSRLALLIENDEPFDLISMSMIRVSMVALEVMAGLDLGDLIRHQPKIISLAKKIPKLKPR